MLDNVGGVDVSGGMRSLFVDRLYQRLVERVLNGVRTDKMQ